jgi:hypothetical protein
VHQQLPAHRSWEHLRGQRSLKAGLSSVPVLWLRLLRSLLRARRLEVIRPLLRCFELSIYFCEHCRQEETERADLDSAPTLRRSPGSNALGLPLGFVPLLSASEACRKRVALLGRVLNKISQTTDTRNSALWGCGRLLTITYLPWSRSVFVRRICRCALISNVSSSRGRALVLHYM